MNSVEIFSSSFRIIDAIPEQSRKRQRAIAARVEDFEIRQTPNTPNIRQTAAAHSFILIFFLFFDIPGKRGCCDGRSRLVRGGLSPQGILWCRAAWPAALTGTCRIVGICVRVL